METEQHQNEYENLTENVCTLSELHERCTHEEYPIVARVVPTVYGIPHRIDLTGNEEVLIEQPKMVEFALVRICKFFDEAEKRREKGWCMFLYFCIKTANYCRGLSARLLYLQFL